MQFPEECSDSCSEDENNRRFFTVKSKKAKKPSTETSTTSHTANARSKKTENKTKPVHTPSIVAVKVKAKSVPRKAIITERSTAVADSVTAPTEIDQTSTIPKRRRWQQSFDLFITNILPATTFKQRNQINNDLTISHILAKYSAHYNHPTDPICDSSRVRKIWRSRDEKCHNEANVDNAICAAESIRLSTIREIEEQRKKAVISEILDCGESWLQTTKNLLDQPLIYTDSDVTQARSSYKSGRALYLRVRQHAAIDSLCEVLSKKISDAILNLVKKCMQEPFSKEYFREQKLSVASGVEKVADRTATEKCFSM